MAPKFNASVSIDCVVFGFDGESVQVLLVKRSGAQGALRQDTDYKLPGSMIYEEENLSSAASRVLEELTGLNDVFLKQLHVFSDPCRVDGDELEWLKSFYRIDTSRVITVAYYALLKLNDKITLHTTRKYAKWIDVQSIRHLALDHKKIVMAALERLSQEMSNSAVAFELLPKKFTIRQLQSLYESVFGESIDNRNFRKKILSLGYLTATGEREQGVAHKPAQYYTFNKAKYQREQKGKFRLNL